MDLDGEGATIPITLEWLDIGISGLDVVQFSGDFAEFFDEPGDIDFDDFIRVEAAIDGGSYETVLEFRLDESEPDDFNGIFREDTDLDGRGDGAALGNAAQTFTRTIAGTGSTLDLRLTVRVEAGDEDFGIDNFLIGPGGPGGPTEVTIPEIQGSGDTSPFVGQEVRTTGVVTADFRDLNGNFGNLSGFFIQDALGDDDNATSDGLFVFTGNGDFAEATVEVGDSVEVTGRVEEAGGDFTQIAALTALTELTPGPTAGITPISLPEINQGELEQYEGMLVEIVSDMVIAQNFFLDRYGQLTLASEGSTTRPIQPTNIFDGSADPASDAQLLDDENLRRILILDDGQDINSNGDNPEPVPFYPSPDDFIAGQVIRAGDGVSNLIGVIDQGTINSRGARDHRLQAISVPEFDERNPRTEFPDDVGGSLKVASFNVLNYFATIDEFVGGVRSQCGPNLDQNCRGADSEEEFNRQTAKLVAAICAMNADIVGLIEIENGPDGANPSIGRLIEAMGDCGDGSGPDLYAGAAPAGPLGSDVITNPFIYKPSTVAPLSDAVLDNTVDPRFDTDNQRPAYAVTFEELATGERVTVVNNHFKSKGTSTGKPGDEDQGDLQGSSNFTRTQAALALVDWLSGANPTGIADSDFLIIGDLNSYSEEDPLQVLQDGGFTDLLEQELDFEDAYSFTFDGQIGALDHALGSSSLVAQVTGVTAWHINTDEPDFISFDQNFNPEGYFVPDAYRASDHDPIIVGLSLTTLEVTARSKDSLVQLSWTDVPDATGYDVYRSTTSGGPYTLIATVTDYTVYIDTAVVNDVEYFYVVEVIGPDATPVAVSSEVSVTPQARKRRR